MTAILKSTGAWIIASLSALLTADTGVQAAGELAGMDWFIL